MTVKPRQATLFDPGASLPEGFRYEADVLSLNDERELVQRFVDLPFREFEFHGYVGKRRVVSFGWSYDFSTGRLRQVDPIPFFLLPVREKAARFAGVAVEDFEHVLLTEYAPGAAIGWHKDKAVFGDVVGMSLASSCTFRFRRKRGPSWERASLQAEPRSAYLLQGPSRSEWEHSIPAVDRLRYSITFRNLKPR